MPKIEPSKKLSSIVAYDKSIEFNKIWEFYKDTEEMLYAMLKTIKHSHYLNPSDFGHKEGHPWEDQINLISQDHSDIMQAISKFNDDALRLHDIINDTIKANEPEYFANSYTIYNQGRKDTPDFILERTSHEGEHYYDKVNDLSVRKTYNIAETLAKRISLYSNWKYSGMHIRPGKNNITPHMVSLDPLYIVDEHIDLLKPTQKSISEEYKARLRFKLINDDDEFIFKSFSKNQIGFILITDFFDYKPLEIIKKYLNQLMDILCPGGVIMFTYNNCELPHAIKNVEQSLSSYIPKRYILPFIESIGYEILYSNDKNNISWIEIKKEGTISSLRGGQALAQINY